ncbi:MAG: serine hydrolase [Bacteroidota bacterium]
MTQKQKHISFLLLVGLLLGTACNPDLPKQENPGIKERIDDYVKEQMELHDIPGVALALIQNGKVIHREYYGSASPSFNLPVGPKHLFRVYSTTKLLVSTAIFQLLEANKLQLEDKISDHIGRIPNKWDSVEIRHLLTHSSGLPNFIHFDNRLSDEEMWVKLVQEETYFEPGAYWQYNQTNYWILAQIIERLSGKSLAEFIIQHQFYGAGDGILFSSNSLSAIPNRISKFNYNNDEQIYFHAVDNEKSRGLAGNGLNISLDRFVEWGIRWDSNQLLNDSTRQLMLSNFDFTEEERSFLHGWGDYSFDTIKSVGFTGGGVSAFRNFPNENTSIIFLSNGFKHAPVHNTMVNRIAGILDPSLRNSDVALNETIFNSFISKDFEEAMTGLKKIKQEFPTGDYESIINQIGYVFLGKNATQKAIDLFEWNTIEYPGSSNTYDSLGEAYLLQDRLDLAIKSYEKALKLNPSSNHAKEMVLMIRKKIDESGD